MKAFRTVSGQSPDHLKLITITRTKSGLMVGANGFYGDYLKGIKLSDGIFLKEVSILFGTPSITMA